MDDFQEQQPAVLQKIETLNAAMQDGVPPQQDLHKREAGSGVFDLLHQQTENLAAKIGQLSVALEQTVYDEHFHPFVEHAKQELSQHRQVQTELEAILSRLRDSFAANDPEEVYALLRGFICDLCAAAKENRLRKAVEEKKREHEAAKDYQRALRASLGRKFGTGMIARELSESSTTGLVAGSTFSNASPHDDDNFGAQENDEVWGDDGMDVPVSPAHQHALSCAMPSDIVWPKRREVGPVPTSCEPHPEANAPTMPPNRKDLPHPTPPATFQTSEPDLHQDDSTKKGLTTFERHQLQKAASLEKERREWI